MAKRIICLYFFIIFILSIQHTAPAFANSNIQVVINNEKVQFDVEPRIINGRTFVPIRAVCEKMGADVYWDDGLILIVKNDIKIGLALESDDIFIIRCNNFEHLLYMIGYDVEFSNYKYRMDVEPIVVDGRTLLPIRYVCEELGASVKWNDVTRTVEIIYSQEQIEEKNKDKKFALEFFDYEGSGNVKRKSNATNHEERIQEALHLLKVYLWGCLAIYLDDYYIITNTKLIEGFGNDNICIIEFTLKERLPERDNVLYYQIKFYNDGTYNTYSRYGEKSFQENSIAKIVFGARECIITDYKDRYNCRIGFLTLD